MTSDGLRRVAALVLRFGVLYAVLLAISIQAPVFERLELPLVASVDALLVATEEPGRSRRIELVEQEPDWVYLLRLEENGERRQLERRYHPHAYVLLLLLSLVLATSSLSWRQRGLAVGIGGALCFVLLAGLLLSDVQAWERAALQNPVAADGPLAWAGRGFDALHRSTGAGLLPLLLWLLYVAWAGGSSAREVPPGSRRESV